MAGGAIDLDKMALKSADRTPAAAPDEGSALVTGFSPLRASIRCARSNGSCAAPSSPARTAASSSSSATSKCRGHGRRPPPTSSSPSTSAGRSARRGARPASRQLISRVVDTITGWGEQQRLLRARRRARDLPRRTDPSAGQPEGRVQQPGLFQRRYRAQAAMLGLLHPEGRRQHGLDPELVPQRRHDLQRRFRLGRESVGPALVPREAVGRRHRVGTAVVHEGGRRLGGRDQVGRQDPARGQDGGAQRRPSRHRRFHQVQGRGGEEGVGADRRRLRRLARRPGLRLGLLPERQQFGARDRRVHARRDRRRQLADPLSSTDGEVADELPRARPAAR